MVAGRIIVNEKILEQSIRDSEQSIDCSRKNGKKKVNWHDIDSGNN